MLFLLTCALCSTQPVQDWSAGRGGSELRLSLSGADSGAFESYRWAVAPAQHLAALAPRDLPSLDPNLPGLPGSGDGDHSTQMSPMWVVMGAMMVVMMVAGGAYLMRQGNSRMSPSTGVSLASPAMRAIPVPVTGGG